MSSRNTSRGISAVGTVTPHAPGVVPPGPAGRHLPTPGGSTPGRAAPRRLVVLLAGLILVVAACSGGASGTDGAEPATTRATTTTTLPPAEVTATIDDGATDVSVAAPIGVTVAHGTFESVTLSRGADATFAPEPAEGVLNADRTGWLGPSDFAPNSPYVIEARVAGVDGTSTDHTWNFTTGAATLELHTSTNVGDGATYGIGMPIIVTLNTAVPEALRKAVTDRMQVTSEPAVTGGWRWFTDTEVHFRPAEYWPAHTAVHLNIDFAGLHLGGGVWGVDGRTVDFAIGDAHISVVDAAAHTMSVQVNGQVVNTFPVSTGRPGPTTETRSGIHVVNEKAPMVIMDSSTIGIPVDSPEGYRVEAEWSVRISNSGEFVHSAPWSVDSQGRANVSHGCVNAAPADARWFYDLTMTGDVVQVINTPRQLEPWNGYGDWQVPWDQWVN